MEGGASYLVLVYSHVHNRRILGLAASPWQWGRVVPPPPPLRRTRQIRGMIPTYWWQGQTSLMAESEKVLVAHLWHQQHRVLIRRSAVVLLDLPRLPVYPHV